MVIYIDEPRDYYTAMGVIQSRTRMAVDTETTGIDPLLNEILMIQIGNAGTQYVFDYQRLKHKKADFDVLRRWLADPCKQKLFHNAKFDYKFLKHHLKCEINNIICTFIVEHTLKKGIRQRGFNLAEVADRYVGADLEKATRQTFVDHEIGEDFTAEQIEYAAKDVEFLIPIFTEQMQLVRYRGIEELVALECKAIAPTADMELNGVYVSPTKWLNLARIANKDREVARGMFIEEVKDSIPKLQQLLREESVEKAVEGYKKNKKTYENQGTFSFISTGPDDIRKHIEDSTPPAKDFEINIDSPVQVQKLLTIHLDTDVASTGEEKLKILNHPAADKLIAYRKATKLCTTYGDEFLRKAIHPITHRIHTNFNQTRAESGRYSSSDPVNLQNIPNKAEYRSAFQVQSPTWKMVCCDYASCELRILAEISQEQAWINAYKQGLDMHSMVASMMFGIAYEDIVDENNEVREEYKDLRTRAKAIGFGK